MPVPLIVIGIIALIIAGIMAIRATVYIDYRDEVRLTVSVAGLKIKILPKKEPAPVNIDDYSPKKFKKMLAKKKKTEEKTAAEKAVHKKTPTKPAKSREERSLNRNRIATVVIVLCALAVMAAVRSGISVSLRIRVGRCS